jgi:TonB family protein
MAGMPPHPPRFLALFASLTLACLAQQVPSIAVEEAVAPAYPAAALEGRIGGTVTVAVRVSERGAVLHAGVSEGHALLRQASLEAARLWRFRAQPQDHEVKLTFSYRLMPKNTPEPQLGTVFRPPYTVEVRKIPADPVIHFARAAVTGRAPAGSPGPGRPPG